MSERSYPAIEALIDQADEIAAGIPDPLRQLVEAIRLTGDRGADPYLVIGVLVESAACTLAKHVPPERQGDTAAALTQLLTDRLNAHRLL